MELFFPFIYKKQEKERAEQISLYIEDIPTIISEQNAEIEEPERVAIIEVL